MPFACGVMLKLNRFASKCGGSLAAATSDDNNNGGDDTHKSEMRTVSNSV